MKKNNGLMLSIISLILAIIDTAAAVFAITRLPETVPLHFNGNWECDGVGSRWMLLILAFLPLIAGAAALAANLLGKPKNQKVTSKVTFIIVLYLSVIFWLLYPSMSSGVGIGDKLDVQAFPSLLILLFAALFIALGNYMPVIEPNRTLGIRIRPTLNDPDCWRATHRMTGRLWVVTGLFLAAASLVCFLIHLKALWILYTVFFIIFAVNMIVPIAFAHSHKNG